MSFEEYAVMAINHHFEERNKYLKKEIKEKEEKIQAKEEEHKKKLKEKEEKINKIRKLFKDFCENEDEEAMNTIKSILL